MRNFWRKFIVGVLSVTIVTTVATPALATESNITENLSAGSAYSFGWSFYFDAIKVENSLHTVQTIVGYEGDITLVPHDDYPAQGCAYVLTTVEVTKDRGSNTVDLSRLQLTVGDKTYSRMADSTFLSDHNMTVLPSRSVSMGTQKGTAVFEVPTAALAGMLPTSFVLSYQDIPFLDSATRTDVETNIPFIEDVFVAQATTEFQMLESFAQGNYTLENPMVVLNPYGNAPLAALAMFETDEPATVDIVVQGKTDDADVAQSFDTPSTFHEIPILGLYAGVRNHVTVTVHNQSGTTSVGDIYIDTDPLPANYVSVDVTTKTEDMEPGMTFLYDWNKNVIDCNGDIRWCAAETYMEVYQMLSNGHFLFPKGGVTGGIATVYERDLLGKTYGVFDVPDGVHHEITELPNGNLLVATNNLETGYAEDCIVELNRTTGKIVREIDLKDVFDHHRDGGLLLTKTDWFHLNTIVYHEGDLIVSGRAQNTVARISYPDCEIKWILGPHDNWTEEYQQYLLNPVDVDGTFDWVWGQHAPMVLPDFDEVDNTLDILVFDNGNDRSMVAEDAMPIRESYSRLVHYRIDETANTVEQIRSYGETRGTELFSYSRGDANYYPETNNWLGTFATISRTADNETTTDFAPDVEMTFSTLVEVNEDNEVVWEANLKNPVSDRYWTYRSERADMYHNNWTYSIKDKVLFDYIPTYYKQDTIEKLTETTVDAEGTLLFALENLKLENGMLSGNGWGIIPKVASDDCTIKLAFQSEDRCYTYDIKRGTREDITNARPGDGVDYDSCGFAVNHCYINALEPGMYIVGLLIESDSESALATQRVNGKTYYFTVGEGGTDVACIDLLEKQADVNAALQKEYAETTYTLTNPLIQVDPYELAPLSAIAMFKTGAPATISISVAGLNGGKTITHDFGGAYTTDHTISIYGLYAEQATDVTLTATYEDGTTSSSTIFVAGHALPELLDAMSVDYLAEGAADDLIFCQPPSRVGVAYAIDNTGAIRWVFSDHEIAVATAMIQLGNGHFLTNSEKTMGSLYAESIYEIDYAGRIYKEYMINNVHHDTAVMANGNILAVSGDYDNNTLEDAVFELDGKTGEILRYWDLTSYFPVGNKNEAGELTADVNYGSGTHDWFHTNSIEYRESDNSMVLSGRMQDAVIKINLDTGELAWILSDHDDLWPDALADKLLTPVGDLTDFEWQFGQHNATWLPNGDLMLFDNGTWRSKDAENIVPVEDSYSRVVVYHIDEEAGTVEHVWQYGKELGRDYLSNFISSAQWLGENHYFMDFGGGQTDADGNHGYGNPNRHAQIVELKDGEVVFKASNTSIGITAGTYQALRLNIYNGATEYDLSENGARLGSNFKSNYVEKATLDTTTSNTFDVDRATVEDNGTQLEVFINLTDVVSTDVMNLYMVGDDTYCFPVSSKTTIQTKLNSTELPVGRYHLYLTKNNAICDLEKIWNVEVEATPAPTCYDITVAINNTEAGWTSESGFYCANTAVTVKAEANDGYTFEGWQKDGRTVSADAEYTFIPTADATLTAIFESEEDDTPSGGSTGGSSSGGGSFVTTTYTVETSYDGKGTITPDADELFEGQSETFYFEAAEGYEITDVLVNGKSVGAVDEYTVEDIDDDIVIEVIFSEIEATPLAFVDVVEGAYYYDAVRWAVENGVTSGTTDTTFSPDTVCTRAQAVTFLWKAAGSPVMDSEMTFTDVAKGAWYYDAVLWAVTNGITDGTGDGSTFSPDMTCDRSQIITFIWRSEGEPVVNYLMDYTDVPADTWYTEAVRWAVSKGITDGTSDTTFSPALDCTRGQIATFMYRNRI